MNSGKINFFLKFSGPRHVKIYTFFHFLTVYGRFLKKRVFWYISDPVDPIWLIFWYVTPLRRPKKIVGKDFLIFGFFGPVRVKNCEKTAKILKFDKFWPVPGQKIQKSQKSDQT